MKGDDDEEEIKVKVHLKLSDKTEWNPMDDAWQLLFTGKRYEGDNIQDCAAEVILSNSSDVTQTAEKDIWMSTGQTATFTLKRVDANQTGGTDEYKVAFDATDNATYVIGTFHTHTPTTYVEFDDREVGPSKNDKGTLTDPLCAVPGVVYDYEADPLYSKPNHIPKGHPKDAPYRPYELSSPSLQRRATP